jgi:hypothetical protein
MWECSFCLEEFDDIRRFYDDPGAFYCRNCVDLAIKRIYHIRYNKIKEANQKLLKEGVKGGDH